LGNGGERVGCVREKYIGEVVRRGQGRRILVK